MTVLLEDPAAMHQIVLRSTPGMHAVAVSCTCLRKPRGGRPGHVPIEQRSPFPAAEAVSSWRAWHESQGIEVAP